MVLYNNRFFSYTMNNWRRFREKKRNYNVSAFVIGLTLFRLNSHCNYEVRLEVIFIDSDVRIKLTVRIQNIKFVLIKSHLGCKFGLDRKLGN